MAANDTTKTAAYENYPQNLLSRGSSPQAGVPVTTGTYVAQRVNTQDFNELLVEADLIGGAADGDLTVVVFPVDMWGVVMPVALTPINSTGPKFNAAGSGVFYQAIFDVSGQNAVEIRATNNNAATKNVAYSYKLT
jgi:hypothetical protein